MFKNNKPILHLLVAVSVLLSFSDVYGQSDKTEPDRSEQNMRQPVTYNRAEYLPCWLLLGSI